MQIHSRPRVHSSARHLDNSFIVIESVKHGFAVNKFCACDNVVHIRQLIILAVTMILRFGFDVDLLALTLISKLFSQCQNVVRMQYFNQKLPEIKSSKTIDAQTSIQRKSFRFNWTPNSLERTFGSRRYTESTSEVDFESSRSPAKSES